MNDKIIAPSDVVAAKILDATGLGSPMPLLRAKAAILDIKVGAVLSIKCTDPADRKDFPGWCSRAGHEYLGERNEKGDSYFYFLIQRGC
jgi:tRNA 2-thiouridine synthesizing protein A